MDSIEYFLIAQISSTVNKAGYLNLKNYSDFSEGFLSLEFVFIDVFGDKRKFFIEDFYFSGEQAFIKFENFDSIEDVSFLVRKNVFIDKENFIKNDSDEFLVDDLIGAKVFRGDKFFGKLMNIENYPGNDVLSIEDENGEEFLVPAVKAFIERIDEKNKIIYLNPEMDLDYDEV